MSELHLCVPLRPAAGAAIQKRIAARERQIKAHYDAFHSSQAAAADAEDALDLMANNLGAAEDEAQRAAAACGHLRAELERRREAVAGAQAKLEAARVRLVLEGQQLGSLQQKVRGPGGGNAFFAGICCSRARPSVDARLLAF